MEEYLTDERNPDPSLVGKKFAQGDIIITTITCAGGEVITLRLDTTLPRTYSREFTVRGTKGYGLQDSNLVMLEPEVNMHEYFDADKTNEKYMNSADKYEEYLPDIWREKSKDAEGLGHGGMDYWVVRSFLDAVLNDEEMPIDVCDIASWMAITPLSEQLSRTAVCLKQSPISRAENGLNANRKTLCLCLKWKLKTKKIRTFSGNRENKRKGIENVSFLKG